MVEITCAYEGQLHCTAKHGPSGSVIATDAPVDNMGRGEAFSPTDLVATALATCMLTTVAIVAERHKIEIKGATAKVMKIMATQPTRRIGELAVEIHFPAGIPEDQRARLENAAQACPVHRSLHPDVKIPVTIHWD
jgi:putative redox protein